MTRNVKLGLGVLAGLVVGKLVLGGIKVKGPGDLTVPETVAAGDTGMIEGVKNAFSNLFDPLLGMFPELSPESEPKADGSDWDTPYDLDEVTVNG